MTLRLDEPFRWGASVIKPQTALIPHDGMAQVAKAATGWQQFYNGVNQPLSSMQNTPAKMMREAQALYHTNRWIGIAERTVTRKVASLPWHVEDENDDEVDDETANPALQAVRDLLEKPQAALPMEDRQPGITTRRGLTSITSRHMGLCGIGYWFLDQMDQGGMPLALIYVNPARVTPKITVSGNLAGYLLDADDYGNGGTPLRVDQVLPFYLEVPDWGATTYGLVLSAGLTARIVTSSDLHTLSVLGTGGRIAGIISPKDAYIEDDEQFQQLERDFRIINESPDAAKRTNIVRGPIDFTQTAADPQQLALADLQRMSANDILAVWGVPPSQAGVPEARGLNSGESGKHEYEVLMTGPVHDRVVTMQEVIQYDLLDRFKAAGISPELVIEEPSFDDDAPAYALAQVAKEQPLTNNERRAIIGLDPLPDYGPDGEPLGTAIVLPMNLVTWAQGAEDGTDPKNPFPNAPKPKPTPTPPQNLGVLPSSPQAQIGAGAPPVPAVPAKANSFSGLRQIVDKRTIPQVRKALERFLEEQRQDIAARIRNASARQLKDESYWFRDDAWDKALAKVLRPFMSGVAQTVTERTAGLLAPGKAKKVTAAEVATAVEETPDSFVTEVERFVLEKTGLRIGGINQTTRDAVAAVIRAGVTESLTSNEIADRIGQMSAFDEARAELVARTETGFAYNAAAISSYQQYGVDQVEAIDGDYDEVCAERNGQIFSVEDAFDIEDHPNGTLDWAPVVAKAEPMLEVAKAMLALAGRESVVNVTVPPAQITVPPAAAPLVTVNVPKAEPVVNVKATLPAELKITGMPDRVTSRKVERDKEGRITRTLDVESDA